MSGTVQDALDAGREAMRRHDWEEARRLLAGLDAETRYFFPLLTLGRARECLAQGLVLQT